MGRRGPKKTPTAILERRGSRLVEGREGEPEVVPGMPPDPAWAQPPEARALWDSLGPELVALGVLCPSDGLMFGALCELYAEWRAAVEDGRSPYSPLDRLIKLGHEFGLTPSSRAGLKCGRPSDEDVKVAKFFKVVGTD